MVSHFGGGMETDGLQTAKEQILVVQVHQERRVQSARVPKLTNKRVAEQIEAAHKTALAKREVGIRERKTVPMLKEFAERTIFRLTPLVLGV
jgi:hypothetical protein